MEPLCRSSTCHWVPLMLFVFAQNDFLTAAQWIDCFIFIHMLCLRALSLVTLDSWRQNVLMTEFSVYHLETF